MIAWYSRERSPLRSAISFSLSVVVAIGLSLRLRNLEKLQEKGHTKYPPRPLVSHGTRRADQSPGCARDERTRFERGPEPDSARHWRRRGRAGDLCPQDAERTQA